MLNQTKRTRVNSPRFGAVLLHTPLDDRVQWCAGEGYGLPALPGGAVALDIGGNIGDTALQLHRLSPSLRIVMLEPVPLTYFYMRCSTCGVLYCGALLRDLRSC